MNNLNFKKTFLLAINIYKKTFNITFTLAFILSFISKFFIVYLKNNGINELIQSNDQSNIDALPSGKILITIFLIIIITTIFVYGMIILLQGIMIKDNFKVLDALKITLRIFYKRMFMFIGVFLLSMIILSTLTIFLQYIGIFLALLLFLTVMPTILLTKKRIFEAFLDNLYIIKNNFFYMFKICMTVLLFMIIKPFIIFLILYLLKNFGFQIVYLEGSFQNVLLTLIDAFILPFIFAISVATFFVTNNK